MRALITGIEGFVGSYLTKELQAHGIEVYGTFFDGKSIVNEYFEDVELHELNVLDRLKFKEIIDCIKPDYVLHLAAQSSAALSWKNPQITMSININGTINLLEAVRETNKSTRIMLFGSSEQYGVIKEDELPIKETNELRPGNPYSISKTTQESIAQLYIDSYNLDIVLTRSFNHIGLNQSTTFVIPDIASRIAQIEAGEIEPTLKMGNLEASRDFTDVSDVVRAYYVILTQGAAGEVYNVGSGTVKKIRDIVDYMLSKSSIDIVVKRDPNRMRPSDNPIIQCDNTKLRKLGWEKQKDILDSINEILDYWRRKYKSG